MQKTGFDGLLARRAKTMFKQWFPLREQEWKHTRAARSLLHCVPRKQWLCTRSGRQGWLRFGLESSTFAGRCGAAWVAPR